MRPAPSTAALMASSADATSRPMRLLPAGSVRLATTVGTPAARAASRLKELKSYTAAKLQPGHHSGATVGRPHRNLAGHGSEDLIGHDR